MDYQIGLFIKGLIIILGNLNCLYCEIERDLILTPKLALHINGKTLYYKPTTSINNQNTTSSYHVPWEQTLKHVTFLTLHNDLEEIKDLNNFIDYKKFMNSSYIPVISSYIPLFGDIITLARGRLEKIENKNEFRFIEGQCDNNNCDHNNILAYWQVQKIRHRDIDRKFRYEIKFSINPRINNNVNNETNGKREININNANNRFSRQSHTLKSFILKDNDYPKSFSYLDEHIAQRRYEENRNIYLERLSAFNEVFTHPQNFDIDQDRKLGEQYHNHPNNNMQDLNIGEYILPNRKNFIQPPESLSRISFYNNHNNLPTTYRPNYNLKFTKSYSNPNSYYNQNQQSPSTIRYPEHIHNEPILPLLPIDLNENIEKNKLITTHLHHHYYLKNNQNNQAERPELYNNYKQEQRLKTESIYQQNDHHQATINLIQQPLTTLSAPIQNIHHTPPPSFLNQIPIPPHQQQQSHQPFHPHDQYSFNNNNNRGTNPNLQSPPLFYMHPIPISSQVPLYLFPNTQQRSSDEQLRTQPFRESYRIENQVQYSEPDPLYENNRQNKEKYSTNNNLRSETTKKYENIVNTESNIIKFDTEQQNTDEKYRKPDSINAQLPPPDDDEDLTVPYVENSSSVTESSSESPTQLVQKQINQPTRSILITASTLPTTTSATIFQPTQIHPTLKRSNQLQISNTTNLKQFVSKLSPPLPVTHHSTNLNKLVRISTTLQPKLNNVNNFISSTNINTESSAIKYLKPTTTFKPKEVITIQSSTTVKPKIIMNDKSIITTTKKIYHRSTTERPVLKWKPKRAKITKELKPILPTKSTSISSKFEFERVPVNVTERVFTVTPSKIHDISTKKSVSKSVSIKVGTENKERPFSPKVKIPNVEVYEADLIKVNTTDKGIKFFKAFSGRDEREKTKENDIEEAELTQSIVEHVRSL